MKLKPILLLVSLSLALAAAAAAGTATASVFVAEKYPATATVNHQAKELPWESNLRIGSVEIPCNLPGIAITNLTSGTEKLQASTEKNGACKVSGKEKPLEMKGCQFFLEPGSETSADHFAGKVGIGPSGCGPIRLDISLAGCSGLLMYPSTMTAPAEYVNKTEGGKTFVKVDLEKMEFEASWESPPLSCSNLFTEFSPVRWEASATTESGLPNPFKLVPSGSGTVLCKVAAQSPCSYANQYSGGVAGSSTLAKIAWTYSGGPANVSCTGSGLEAASNLPGAGALDFDVYDWSLTGCKFTVWGFNLGKCTAPAVNMTADADLSWTEAGNGTFTVGAGTGGEPGWRIACEGTSFDCTFGLKGKNLTFKGGNPASLSANEMTVTETPNVAKGCPSENGASTAPKFTSTYTINTPKPIYVASGTK